MNVLIDTSIWSEVLRRRARGRSPYETEVQELIDEGRVVIFGPIRQEILSGIKSDKQFEALRDILRAFSDYELMTEDFEEAAVCFNRCQRRGIQGSNTDFLICAIALRNGFEIFTRDKDFAHFKKALRVKLYAPRFQK